MITQIAILVILIGLNAFFAASEIAFIALNDTKIEKQAKEGNKKAKQIAKMLEVPSKFLSTIQIGITLAGFLSSAFASDAFASKLAPVLNNMIPIGINIWQNISILIITIILSFFTIVFGELVPKRLAMKHYEKIAFATIGIIRTISIITAPFVKLLSVTTNAISKIFGVGENEEEIVTEEEIKMMVDQGKEDGTIQEDEKEYIKLTAELYGLLKELRHECYRYDRILWSNITISIENVEFLAEYNCDDLINSNYTSEDRMAIWQCKYLDYPMERFPKDTRNKIEEYLEEEEKGYHKIKQYIETFYNKHEHNSIEYNINKNNEPQYIKVDETRDFTIVDEEQQYQIKSRKRSKFGKKKLLQERNEETKTEQLQEPEVMVRNQILKY